MSGRKYKYFLIRAAFYKFALWQLLVLCLLRLASITTRLATNVTRAAEVRNEAKVKAVIC
ncbi:hypothetical protein [Adhaeribacter aquaticus]|uniref:hypothetical protein n=1 Tax=Adhaeribacter aquaticus TaxID=299567 RepID=UPI00146FC22E|nr:hypothetical protein [Adhaeribacter aquaticus]